MSIQRLTSGVCTIHHTYIARSAEITMGRGMGKYQQKPWLNITGVWLIKPPGSRVAAIACRLPHTQKPLKNTQRNNSAAAAAREWHRCHPSCQFPGTIQC